MEGRMELQPSHKRCNATFFYVFSVATSVALLACPVPINAAADTTEEEPISLQLGESIWRQWPVPSTILLIDENPEDSEDQSDSEKADFADEIKNEKEPRWQYELDGLLAYRTSWEWLDEDPRVQDENLRMQFGIQVEHAAKWEFKLALGTYRPNRPTTDWVLPEDLSDTHWLRPQEYWVRKDCELRDGQELRLQAGRFNYPFELTQLVFDNDLYLPGVFAQYQYETTGNGPWDQLGFAVFGAQLHDGNDDPGSASRLVSARLDSCWRWHNCFRLDAALSYHNITDVDTIGRAVAKGDWRVGGIAGQGETTNYTGNTGALSSNYRLADAWLEAEWWSDSDWPLSIELEYVRNMGAKGTGGTRDTAYYACCEIGRNGDPGDWQFGVERIYIEPEAVLAAVNRGSYGTNYRATWLTASYTISEHLETSATYTLAHSIFADAPLAPYDLKQLKLYLTYSW